MKKSFKILSSLLAPVAVLGTTAVAIPLASCSNSKKDTSEYDVKATFTNNDSSINNGSPISIDFGASTTIKADISITKGGEEQSLDDLTYAWSLTSTADGVTISNETKNTVIITNNNSSSSEVSVGLKLTISSPTANFNNKEVGNFTLNCNAEEKNYDATVLFTIKGSAVTTGDTITVNYGESISIKATVKVTENGEEQSLKDLTYSWSSDTLLDGVTISDVNSYILSVTNNNSSSGDVSTGLKLTISSPTANFNNKEMGNFTLNCKAQEVEPGENDNLNADTKWNWVGSFDDRSVSNKSTYDEAIENGAFSNGNNSLTFNADEYKQNHPQADSFTSNFAAYNKDTGAAEMVSGINHSSFNIPTISFVNEDDKKYFTSYEFYPGITSIYFQKSLFNESQFTSKEVKITFKVTCTSNSGGQDDTFYLSILISSEFFS